MTTAVPVALRTGAATATGSSSSSSSSSTNSGSRTMNAATSNGEPPGGLLLYNYGLVQLWACGLGEPTIRSNNYGLMGFAEPETPPILVKSANFGLAGSVWFEGVKAQYY